MSGVVLSLPAITSTLTLSPHTLSHRDGAGDGGLLALIGDALAGDRSTATVGELDHDGGVDLLQGRV